MKLLSVMIAAVVAAMSATAAFASDTGPYVSVGAGVFVVPDSEVHDSSGSYQLSYDTGYSVSGAVGYAFDNNLRTELEVAYRHADTNALKMGGDSVHYLSDITSVSVLTNLFYDVKLPHGVTPYLGGGLGVAFMDTKQDNLYIVDNRNTSNLNAGTSDTVLAYQLGCGIAYAVTPRISLDAGYRYFATDDVAVNTYSAGKQEFATHIGQMAIRYRF
ncbi:outer membrane protein [Geobacter sp. AOG2]|uniref:outer membrane protein n=1 Tax=Geobacter sp. AOG2 TaxID=1566347 RepID=UPI001CC70956|nr:outer membrane beta-barrel protein [Geobacter sp. AOG2]